MITDEEIREICDEWVILNPYVPIDIRDYNKHVVKISTNNIKGLKVDAPSIIGGFKDGRIFIWIYRAEDLRPAEVPEDG